jgi:hypothetical protein
MFAADIKQTMRRAYQDIRDGNDPWVALGDFSHDWYGNYAEPGQRVTLVAEPIELPDEEAQARELLAWAAFCAASVEYLCLQAAMPVPEWVKDPRYVLSEQEAFYTSPLAYKQRVRERLQHEAPEPFRRRNVFCSERVYANKYETAPVSQSA